MVGPHGNDNHRMGRPYARELDELGETYGWASQQDSSGLEESIRAGWSLPLVAVGSGGSLTAAAMLVWLHRRFTATLAHTSTPYELESSAPGDGRCAIWLLSARGQNGDIIRAFRGALIAEPRELVVACANRGSRLLAESMASPWVTSLAFDLPVQRDGFLATNSLVALCTLLSHAYSRVAGGCSLPADLSQLWSSNGPEIGQASLEDDTSPLWQRKNLVVLFGRSAGPAAIDVESKFTEAGLASVQLSDLRNFGHGRHHFLAKNRESTSVVAIVHEDEKALCDSTLRDLPEGIPRQAFVLRGPQDHAALAGVVLSLRLAGIVGKARGIDPGRPGVPEFGRRLYSLRTKWPQARKSAPETIAPILRKRGFPMREDESDLEAWRHSYEAFLCKLQSTQLTGVVLDYDGTLVETRCRRSPPCSATAARLTELVRMGFPIAIATGRGSSVRDSLRGALPHDCWRRVLVGYRNGSEIALLDESTCPSESTVPSAELETVVTSLRELLGNQPPSTTLRVRTHQITLELPPTPFSRKIIEEITQHVEGLGDNVARIVVSAHSLDILSSRIDKRLVVEALATSAGSNSDTILRIGDQGAPHGNDHDLLSHELGLSVDRVSARPSVCWNLGRPGTRGTQVTLQYLHSLTAVDGGVRFVHSAETKP